MRIAFMGKGGSGKTTLTAAFTKYLLKEKKESPILLFDVDLNSHLADEMGVEFPVAKYFGGIAKEMYSIFEPKLLDKHKQITTYPEFGSIVPNDDTYFIDLSNKKFTEHPFISNYGYSITQELYMFVAGNHVTKGEVGHSCYHDWLNSFELTIHRINDQKDSYVVADTTAGIDNVGTSLYMAYDLVIFVVEPTERSISVYKDYINVPEVNNSQVFVVCNKIESAQDESFIRENIENSKIISIFRNHKEIYRDADEKAYNEFILTHQEQLHNILSKLDNIEKDWDLYYKKLYELFQKEAKGWWNNYYGVNLEQKFKEDYSFLNSFKK